MRADLTAEEDAFNTKGTDEVFHLSFVNDVSTFIKEMDFDLCSEAHAAPYANVGCSVISKE